MKGWLIVLAVVLPGAIFLVLSVAFYLRCRRRQRRLISDTNKHPSETKSRKETLQAGISRLHLSHKSNGGKHAVHLHHHRHRHLFNWDDHPRLVAEAVEIGWSRFAFSCISPSSLPPRSSSLLNLCVACDQGRPAAAEINWEVPPESSDFMQTVRLNRRSKSPPGGDDDSYSCVRMGLPLPGPPLGDYSFPQEAYFEITILHLQQRRRQKRRPSRRSKRVRESSGEGDRAKLIQEGLPHESADDMRADGCCGRGGGIDGGSSSSSPEVQESKFASEEESKEAGVVVVSLGLTRGGSPWDSVPGSYPGSIGFNSNGSVYLDGIKLVFESEKAQWGAVNRVIGCGFDPSKKKVFFTMDSVLLHVIHCHSDVFTSPLYPTLAANSEAMVSVNLGQCAFKYAPANTQRTPNPCFLRPSANDPAAHIGYEDSRELFSMGRIDSHWLDKCATRRSNCNSSRNSSNTTPTKAINNNNYRDGSGEAAEADDADADDKNSSSSNKENPSEGSVVVDIEGESELFEIALNN